MKKFSKGMILAFSLILLGIILIISVGMITSSTTNLRSTLVSNNSAQAFQIADSGAQKTKVKIKDLKASNNKKVQHINPGNCTGGKISDNILEGNYTITLYSKDANDNLVEITTCNEDINNVVFIKSVGEYSSTKRAIQHEIE